MVNDDKGRRQGRKDVGCIDKRECGALCIDNETMTLMMVLPRYEASCH